MPDGQSPAITKRRLRSELKGLREQAGLTQAEVVKKLDWSSSKLIRIENGSVGISVTDVRALLGVYKAPEDIIDDLVVLARAARERRWWNKYRDVVPPLLQEFMGFEADAARLRQFHPTLVPGLLQTAAYIRAVANELTLTPHPDSNYESLVEVRLRRQKEILGSENPPDFTVVMDEAVLHRQVAGVEAMRAQLLHIADLQSRQSIRLAVLPFSGGSHFGMSGAFHIMDFADDAEESVLYLENSQGEIALRDSPSLVAQYGKRFEDLLAVSYRDVAAEEYVRKIAKELGR